MYEQLKRDAKRGLLDQNLLGCILEEIETTNTLLKDVVALLEEKEVTQKLPNYDEMSEKEIRELIKIKIPANERPQGWAVQPKERLLEILKR